MREHQATIMKGVTAQRPGEGTPRSILVLLQETADLAGLENNPNLYTKTYANDLKNSNLKPGGRLFNLAGKRFLYCGKGAPYLAHEIGKATQ